MIELVDIPENSLKRYIQEHDNFIKFNKEHNRYKIHESAINVLKKIRKLYGEGHKKDEVNDRLREMGTPMDIVVESDNDEIDFKKELLDMKEMLRKQMEFNTNQMEFNRNLLQDNKELKQMVNRNESERIESLRKTLQIEHKESEEKNQQALKENNEATEKVVKEAIEKNREAIIAEIKKATENTAKETGENNNEELISLIDKATEKAVKQALKDYQEEFPDSPKKKGILGKLFGR
jgi:hypothetical protein